MFELCLARRRKTTVNPVKAGIVNKVNDYEFSSWHEYEDKNSTLFQSGLAKASSKQKDLIQEKFSGLVERLELVKF